MKLNLITDCKNIKGNNDDKYIYLGPVDFSIYKAAELNKKILISSKDIAINDLDKTQRIKKLEYCETLHKKLIATLAEKLNELHKEKYNKKIWELIFGRWLKDFIYISYNNFNIIQNLLKNKKLDSIKISNSQLSDIHTKNYEHLVESYLSTNWNKNLNSIIIKYLKPNVKIETESFKKNLAIENKVFNKLNIFKNIMKFIFPVVNFFLKRKENIFFYKSGLNPIYEGYIKLKTSQSIISEKIPDYNYKENIYNLNQRNNLNLNFLELNIYETFLKNNLKFFLPLYIIEEFKNIKNIITDSKLPKQLDLLLTGTGYTNEVFNIFSAIQASRNCKFVSLQHGNCYNTNYINDYLFEYISPDHFFSWGESKKKNQFSLFNFNIIYRKKLFKKNGNLSIICDSIANRAVPFEIFHIKEENFNNTLNFVQNLNDEIKDRTYLRLLPWNGDDTNEILKKKIEDKNLKLYRENLSIKNILKKSRLNIFNYDSSGFFENLLLDIPSIFFSKYAFQNLKDNCVEDYIRLREAKVIFDDQRSLNLHVESIWKNPTDWWYNSTTQKAVKNFNFKYNKDYKNNLNKMPEMINSLLKSKNNSLQFDER